MEIALASPIPGEDDLEVLAFDEPEGDVAGDLDGYVKIKHGITMDTGSAAFVMPTRWLPMFPLEKGEKAGQRYVGATGKVVQNEGQKNVRFVTRDHEARELTFQCADVNKMLACVAKVTEVSIST